MMVVVLFSVNLLCIASRTNRYGDTDCNAALEQFDLLELVGITKR
jgi:hypothetical protein